MVSSGMHLNLPMMLPLKDYSGRLKFDDTKEFIEKYDLPVTMSLKDATKKR